MGVLGLTPFLQKTCPEVIQSLPDRLQSLSGKRIVIDGTLITQRFHFSQMPQQYKHVLSWYRLVMALRRNNIQAICVFDGGERSLAKEREIARRRRDRMVTAVRGQFESERLSRLRRLTDHLGKFKSAEPDQSKKDLDGLKAAMGGAALTAGVVASAGAVASASVAAIGSAGAVLAPGVAPLIPFGVAALAPAGLVAWALHAAKASPRSSTSHPPEPTISYDPSGQLEARQSPGEPMQVPAAGSPIQANEGLAQLYTEFRTSVPGSESPFGILPHVSTSTGSQLDVENEAAQGEYPLSKNQQELVAEECKLWEQLVSGSESEDTSSSVVQLAETLEVKSSVLSDSYTRRTHAPTWQTYEESREMLRSMGVPCIEASGHFEGEALAASMVISGFADYVASEDTDVLIYGAPLIRNLGNTIGPLVVISGAEVRNVLKLDRQGFIDFALLLGTDFSQRIKNVGPARALKFIREHGCIERVLERETQYVPRVPTEQYLQQVELAREVFATLPPPPESALCEQGAFDEEEVKAILDRYDLRRYAEVEWDYSRSLSGNYFADNPAAL